MTQEQLIRTIEQRLEDLTFLDNDLAYEYECDLYYDCNDDEEPQRIVELFTPQLLHELEQHIEELEK